MNSPARIELAGRALRDLRKMPPPERRRIAAALDELAGGAANLDVKALVGQAPWLRMRVGDWRVLYRPMDEGEAAGSSGWVIARIVNRRDLERAARTL